MSDVRKELFAAVEWMGSIIAKVRVEQLDNPTPCTEFNVMDLLVHILSVGQVIELLPVQGKDPRGSLEEYVASGEKQKMEHYVRNTPVVDIAAAWQDSLQRMEKNWTDSQLEREFVLSWGAKLSGSQCLLVYLFEVTCHGWDLSVATNQSSDAPDFVAETALKGAREFFMNLPIRGKENGVPFEAEVEVSEEVAPTTKLAAFLGRTVPHLV